MKKILKLCFIVGLVVISLSCAKEDSDKTAQTSQTETKAEEIDPNGTLYFRLSNEPTFLNPLLYTDVYSGQIVGMVFNGFFRKLNPI